MKYESQYYGVVQMEDVVEHHGIKGMKWGIRRYQNPDGSLTAAGRSRYVYSGKVPKKRKRFSEKMFRKYALVDTPENKDAAWDNASEMAFKGASDKELTKYLKENGLYKEAMSKFMPKDKIYLNEIQLATDKAIAELELTKSMREEAQKTFKGDGKSVLEKQEGRTIAGSQEEFDKNVKLWTESDYDSLPKKDADAVVDYQGKITSSVYDWYNDKSNNPRVNEIIQQKQSYSDQLYNRDVELYSQSGRPALIESMPIGKPESDKAWADWNQKWREAGRKYAETKKSDKKYNELKKKESETNDELWKRVVIEAGLSPTEENIRKMKALLASD